VLLVSAVSLVGLLYAGQGAERGRVPLLRLPGGIRRRSLLPDVRLAYPGLLRREQQREQLWPYLQFQVARFGRGIGVGASVIDSWGYTGAYWLAAGCALLSAGFAGFLRQPGRRVPAAAPGTANVERPMAATLAD
jgi:hypothetical protein